MELDYLIENYTSEKLINKKNLKNYLLNHQTVSEDIFSYVLLDSKDRDIEIVKENITTMPREKFIKRIPFYFYSRFEKIGDFEFTDRGDITQFIIKDNDNKVEEIYTILEELFYTYKIDINVLMEFSSNVSGYVGRVDILYKLYEYVQLTIKTNNKIDLNPKTFYYNYNLCREKNNLDPIIYEIEYMFDNFYIRNNNIFEFEGTFPCDINGVPVMKWIGLDLKNVKLVNYGFDEHCRGRIYLQVSSNSIIRALNIYNDKDEIGNYYYTLYLGPKETFFDYSVLKEYREKLKMTQKDVANAIDASYRTYQKWESGQTTPDCQNLLRLLNLFDITDLKSIIRLNINESKY